VGAWTAARSLDPVEHRQLGCFIEVALDPAKMRTKLEKHPFSADEPRAIVGLGISSRMGALPRTPRLAGGSLRKSPPAAEC